MGLFGRTKKEEKLEVSLNKAHILIAEYEVTIESLKKCKNNLMRKEIDIDIRQWTKRKDDGTFNIDNIYRMINEEKEWVESNIEYVGRHFEVAIEAHYDMTQNYYQAHQAFIFASDLLQHESINDFLINIIDNQTVYEIIQEREVITSSVRTFLEEHYEEFEEPNNYYVTASMIYPRILYEATQKVLGNVRNSVSV